MTIEQSVDGPEPRWLGLPPLRDPSAIWPAPASPAPDAIHLPQITGEMIAAGMRAAGGAPSAISEDMVQGIYLAMEEVRRRRKRTVRAARRARRLNQK